MIRSLTKMRVILLSVVFLASFSLAALPSVVHAEPVPAEAGGQQVEVSSDPLEYDPGTGICVGGTQRCNHFIDTYINPFLYLLSGLVGIVAVISIIFAGIQYASSADDPGTVTKAKQRIFNTVIGLVAYIFLFAFLEYLIPGGIV
jgi:hypothetical protein